MDGPKYIVGGTVWIAMSETIERHIACPDCGGTKTLQVTLFDETTFRIPCQGCARGCDPPSGLVAYYEHVHLVGEGEVVGVEKDKDRFEYRVSCNERTYIKREEELATDEVLAVQISRERAKRLTEEQQKKASHKYRDTHSWAWHVSYYRKEIREAKSRIEYAEKALGIARAKAKEEKAAASRPRREG